jgi:hypothetical protein
MATPSKLSTKAAITQVLSGSKKLMTVTQIADAAIPLTALAGKTPKQTVYSILYAENKKPDGLWQRTDRGTFTLRRPKRSRKAAA